MSIDYKEEHMKDIYENKQSNNQVTEVTTFPVPFALSEIKENINFISEPLSRSSKEILIDKARNLHLKGNILEAKTYYQHIINMGFNDYRVFSNYAGILKDLGNLKEAEYYIRKAIDLKPELAKIHSNLGSILRDLGKLSKFKLYFLEFIQKFVLPTR